MVDEISELKVTQALLIHKQEQTDIVIARLEKTLGNISKGGYVFLGIYLANSVGAGEAIKATLKLLGG